MKYIKSLICLLICSSLLCGCIEIQNPLKLIKPNEQQSNQENFDALDKAQKTELLVSEIEKAFAANKKTVKFKFDCSDYLFDAYKTVYSENPQFFWLTKSSSYKIIKDGINTTVVFKPKILLTDEEIENMQKEIDAETEKVIEGIDINASDYEKVFYIHDYIVDNTVYDSDGADFITANPKEDLPKNVHNSTSIYGCLITRLAICSGYSATFKYFADKLGLESMRVSGTDKKTGESHQWNCVKVDGDYYYLDATWDDKVSDENDKNYKDYEYFLITEDELSLTHIIEDGAEVPQCTAEKYNYFIYNGLYLDKYDFNSFAKIVTSKWPKRELSVKFGSASECDKACYDLFSGKKRFWKISGIYAETAGTSVSESGKILNIQW